MPVTLETPPRGVPVPVRARWSSGPVFVLAGAGAAIGLANAWRLPYLAGRHGGGAFVAVYIAAVAVIALPLLMAELALGRRGGRNPVGTMRRLARAEGASTAWQALGWLVAVNAFLILSYYSVVAGWVLVYLADSASGALFDAGDPTRTARRFSTLLSDPGTLILGQAVFLVATASVVAAGMRRGLERAARWLVPLMLLLLLGLVLHAATSTGHFREAAGWLFRPELASLTREGVLQAIGQAFFTLSVGAGCMLVYGSHLARGVSIPRASAAVAGLDTAVALLAGLAIFPLVLAHGLAPSEGPGLLFVTVPVALDGRRVTAAALYAFLGLAALTSAIALLEVSVSLLVERYHVSRVRAAWGSALGVWLVGLLAVLSINGRSGIGMGPTGLFDLLNLATSGVLLPLTGAGFAVCAGWILGAASAREELGLPDRWFRVWRVLVRWVVPAVAGVLLVRSWGGWGG